MTKLQSKYFINIQEGDSIRFEKNDPDLFVVQKVTDRYVFAGTEDGCQFTIVDKVEKVLASTNMIIEVYGNFTDKSNVEKVNEMLLSGERELSQKYRTSFKDFDRLGGEVLKKK